MVRYVDTVNGYEVHGRRGLHGLGNPALLALLPAAGDITAKGLELANNAAANWLPAVTGATGASIFSKGVAEIAEADERASNARLIRFALGLGGLVVAGLVIYKVVKS